MQILFSKLLSGTILKIVCQESFKHLFDILMSKHICLVGAKALP